MNFYKLAIKKLPEIQAAMDEAHKSAFGMKSPLRGVKFSVLLHESGEVEVQATVGEDFSAAVAGGSAVYIHHYTAEKGKHERVSAKEAIEAASEDWV